MITATPRSNNDWRKTRESMHRLRDVEASINKESDKKANEYPGRRYKVKATVSGNRSKKDKEDTGRKSFAELAVEEARNNGTAEIKKAMIRNSPTEKPASAETVNKAIDEISKAIRRCGC